MSDRYHLKVQQYRKKFTKEYPDYVEDKYKLDNDIVAFDDFVDVAKKQQEFAFSSDYKLDTKDTEELPPSPTMTEE